jgi:hypothetical protein
MRISRVEPRAADSAFDVTAIAARGRVATQAGCSLIVRFDRMARDEVATVYEVPIDRLGLARLDPHPLRDVVTVVALGLGMTLVAELLRGRGPHAMLPDPICIVPQKSLRQEFGQIALPVTAGALATIELLLMALQTLRHRRKWGRLATFADQTCMAGHTLATDLLQRQVIAV